MSKSKNINPILLIVIIIVIIAIGVGVYFLVTSKQECLKEKYTDSTGQYEICPGNGQTNNSNITSATECKQAKGDKTWGGVDTPEDQPDYPKGCYINDDEDKVWFNPDASGSTDDDSRSICRKVSPVSSAVNVPLMKMSNQKIDCSGKICKIKTMSRQELCISFYRTAICRRNGES